jgi:hypothetical protein
MVLCPHCGVELTREQLASMGCVPPPMSRHEAAVIARASQGNGKGPKDMKGMSFGLLQIPETAAPMVLRAGTYWPLRCTNCGWHGYKRRSNLLRGRINCPRCQQARQRQK